MQAELSARKRIRHLTEHTSTYINVVLPVFVDIRSFDVGEHTAARAKEKRHLHLKNL